MEILNIHNYFKERVNEIKELAQRGDPWVFLCSSAFIDYLVKAVNNKATTGDQYKKFIHDYLSKIDMRYVDFEYKSQDKDLPKQMYHILRCGIVHGFSLIPDKKASAKGGRTRSILLAHQKSNYKHLESYTKDGYDSAIFIAESFSEDLEKLIDKIFNEFVPKDNNLKNNIIEWWNKHTPIMNLPNPVMDSSKTN